MLSCKFVHSSGVLLINRTLFNYENNLIINHFYAFQYQTNEYVKDLKIYNSCYQLSNFKSAFYFYL